MNNHMRLGFRHNPLFGHVNPVDLEKGQFGGGCFSAHAKKRASIPHMGGATKQYIRHGGFERRHVEDLPMFSNYLRSWHASRSDACLFQFA